MSISLASYLYNFRLLQSGGLSLVMILMLGILGGCSGDDDVPPSSSGSLTVISFQPLDGVVQIEVDGGQQVTGTNNLKAELQAPEGSFPRLFQNYLSYFTIREGSITVYRINLLTGEKFVGENIYQLGFEEKVQRIVHSEEKIVIITGISDFLSSNNFAKIIDHQTLELVNINLASGSIFEGDAGLLVEDEQLLIFTLSENRDTYTLQNINLTDANISASLSMSTDFFQGYVFDEQLYAVFPQDKILEIYSLKGLDLISSSTYDFFPISGVGLGQAEKSGSQITTDLSLAQPAPVATIPVVYDINELRKINFEDSFITRHFFDLQAESGLTINAYAVNIAKQWMVLGYSRSATSGPYGLRYISFDGELLEDVEIDHRPDRIVFR